MTVQLVAGLALTCTLPVRHSVSIYHTADVPGNIDPELQRITEATQVVLWLRDHRICNYQCKCSHVAH